MKHVGVGWFAGWLFESVVSPLWVARDWSGSFNCVFHVKHQSSQQLVGEGRRTQSHPQQLNHQPTTFHVKQSQLQNHEGKAENSRLGNTPPLFQLFPRSVFHVKPHLIHQSSPKRKLVSYQKYKEAYSVAGNSIHANGEHIERRYHLACFSKPPRNGHMHQCLEKLNHISRRLKLPRSTWNIHLQQEKLKPKNTTHYNKNNQRFT